MEIKEESGLKFAFPDSTKVIKFDDTMFYRKSFNALPESKGVDFITVAENSIAFIEVKNCTGAEGDCRWRIFPNNSKKNTSHTNVNLEGRNSLDIEVPQKVAMTLAALLGARSFEERKNTVEELEEIQKFIFSKKFTDSEKKKLVILFLEGDFGGHTRSKEMIMSALQKNIQTKMKWLDCRVSVVDSHTYNEKIFRII